MLGWEEEEEDRLLVERMGIPVGNEDSAMTKDRRGRQMQYLLTEDDPDFRLILAVPSEQVHSKVL